MRKLGIIIFAILLILSGCKKESVDFCRDKSLFDLVVADTTISFSYEINNVSYKYQHQRSGYSGDYQLSEDKDGALWFKEDVIIFNTLNYEQGSSQDLKEARLVFLYQYKRPYNNRSFDQNSTLKNHLMETEEDFYFTCFPLDYDENRLPLNGIYISHFQMDFLSHFNNDKAEAEKFLNDRSSFEITSIESVCNGYYNITGQFSTIAILEGQFEDVENGYFSFIAR